MPLSSYKDRLHKADYLVRDITLHTAQEVTRQYHYARGGSNTAVYTHGLFHREDFLDSCLGIAWWLPPTKSAALATYPDNWQGVLSLTRLVITPGVLKNACTFLLSQSVKRIDKSRWPCLVTYADTWQGHDGLIYKASGWKYRGLTKPQPIWMDTTTGKMVARKAGPKTRTATEMEELGLTLLGYFPKHKYVLVRK